jgi:tRNA nucleotidyltransferase/poly(A) polymerase
MATPPAFPPPLAADLAPFLMQHSQVWLVGGAIRDHLLHRQTTDLDFVVADNARHMARLVADRLGADYYDLDAQRDTGRVLARDSQGAVWTLDFAGLRGTSLHDDLNARDFTLNALAVDLQSPGDIIDPTQGLADLRAKVLRACGPHSIARDPVRAVRAVRLATQLSFRIEPGTIAQLKKAHGAMAGISCERMRDETMGILSGARPAGGLRLLDSLGLLGDVLPDLDGLRNLRQPPQHAFDALTHSLAVVDGLALILTVLGEQPDPDASANLTCGVLSMKLGRFRLRLTAHLEQRLAGERTAAALLMLAAAYHDVGKSHTGTLDGEGKIHFLGHEKLSADMATDFADHWGLSRTERERLSIAISNHMRPGQLEKARPITRRAIYRYFRDTGPVGIDIALLSLADFLGKHQPPPPAAAWTGRVGTTRTLMEAYFEQYASVVQPGAIVDGADVMGRLGIGPGPEIGRLLEAIREAQAAGEILDRDSALALAAQLNREARAGSSDHPRLKGSTDGL